MLEQYLPNWLQETTVEHNEEIVDKRLSAIQSFIENIENEIVTINTLIASQFFLEGQDNEILMRLRGEIRNIDSDFPDTGKINELRIIAGATLVKLIENSNDDIALLASIALRSTYCYGVRRKPALQDLLPIADQVIKSKSVETRRFQPSEQRAPIGKTNRSTLDELTSAIEAGNAQEQTNKIRELVEASTANNRRYTSGLAQEISELHQQNKILQEETDILWWFIAQYSNSLNKPYRELTIYDAALSIGMDLSEIIEFSPGPLSIESIVRQTIVDTRPKTPQQVGFAPIINQSSKAIKTKLQKWTSPGPSFLLFTPIHQSVDTYINNESGKEWETQLAPSKLQTKKRLTPQHFGMQTYYERILLKIINGLLG